MLLRKTCAEDLVNVVDIVPAVGRVAVGHQCDLLLREIRNILVRTADVTPCEAVHHIGHIVVVGELRTVHELREVGIEGCANGHVVIDACASPVSLLCGDDDDSSG